jgi:hypothetical protein
MAALALFLLPVAAAGQPLSIITGSNLGTYSVGTVQAALAATGGTPPYDWTLTGGALPPGTALRTDGPSWFPANASAGIIGVTTAAGTANFTLKVTDAASGTATRAFTLQSLALTSVDPWNLPDAITHISYTATLHALGAVGTVSWSVAPGSVLPPGLSLANGAISGSPTTAGSYGFTFAIADSSGTVYRGYNLNVSGPGFVGKGTLGNATIGTALGTPITLAGQGGTPPYTFQGSAPPGLALSSSGALTGTPAGNNGTNQFAVTITDHAGLSYTKTFALNYVGAAGQAVLPSLGLQMPVADAALGSPAAWTLYLYGGKQPYNVSVTGLPTGLSLRPSGADINREISGAPIATGDLQSSVAGSEGQWFQSMIAYLQQNPWTGWTLWALNPGTNDLFDGTWTKPASALKQQMLATVQYPMGPVVNPTVAQTIAFGVLHNMTAGAAAFAVSATATSGLPVSFVSTTTTVCTVTGSQVAAIAAGTCSIMALQGGNTTYMVAPPVTQNLTVAQGTQSIAFGSPGNQYLNTAPLNISATASSGLPVTLASNTPLACTVSGNTVTLAGAGTCSITATQAGNANFAAAAPVTRSFTVEPSKCDINGGGSIDVSDVQLEIDEALGAMPAVHDLNLDGAVNVVDVQIVINAALGLGCAAK